MAATSIYHISKDENVDPLFVSKLLNSLHADDLTTGCNTVNQCLEFYEKAQKCFSNGGFNLRKFKSNCKELAKLAHENCPDDETYSNGNKVLGILWDKQSDQLMFDFNDIRSKFIEEPTKRSIIQSVASIYDPVGLIAPVIVKMKILFPDICVDKFTRVDELPLEFCSRCKEILFDLEQISFIKFVRTYCFYNLHDPVVSVEMHSFSGSSSRMYAAVIYLRYEMKSLLIKLALVCSKSKICSINGLVSTPRAELSGVLLMSKFTSSVLKALQSTLNICENFYWTDLSIINKEKIYKTYVQQRLIQIREFISDFEKIKLVASKLDPANLGTKNLSQKELFSNKLWFSGPQFLSLPGNCWPDLHVGENFSNYNIDDSSINLVDDESLILPSSCTQVM